MELISKLLIVNLKKWLLQTVTLQKLIKFKVQKLFERY